MGNDNALQSYKAQLHPISMGGHELHNELQEKEQCWSYHHIDFQLHYREFLIKTAWCINSHVDQLGQSEKARNKRE